MALTNRGKPIETVEDVEMFHSDICEEVHINFLESGGFLEGWTERDHEEHEERFMGEHFFQPMREHAPELLQQWKDATEGEVFAEVWKAWTLSLRRAKLRNQPDADHATRANARERLAQTQPEPTFRALSSRELSRHLYHRHPRNLYPQPADFHHLNPEPEDILGAGKGSDIGMTVMGRALEKAGLVQPANRNDTRNAGNEGRKESQPLPLDQFISLDKFGMPEDGAGNIIDQLVEAGADRESIVARWRQDVEQIQTGARPAFWDAFQTEHGKDRTEERRHAARLTILTGISEDDFHTFQNLTHESTNPLDALVRHLAGKQNDGR